MEIKPFREIVVEPLKVPIPKREPATPQPRPTRAPKREPQEEPAKPKRTPVPVRR